MNTNRLLSLILTVFLLNTFFINAQTVQWAKKGISEGFENGNAIVADDSGNVYVTGQFEFTSVFNSTTLHAYGQHDIMTIKYGTDGNIKWIRQSGGPGGDIGNGIGIDAQHNVYVTGEFEDSARFGSKKIFTSGGNDGFLVKYDANGNVVWVRDFGCPTSSDKGRALAVSPSGNIYITGNFSVTGNFGGITLNANGGNDIFVVKYDTNGNVVWAKKAGGTRQDRGYGLVLDKNENVYVTGTFTQSATFKNITLTNPGNNTAFLAKYDSGGDLLWALDAGGACCDTTKANSIALDESGNIYVAGYFMDRTEFGSYNLTSFGSSDVFVTKYDPNGNVVWANQAGGTDEDAAYGVVVDTLNHLVYVTGLVRDHGYFDNIHFTIAGYKDIFIAAYTMNGQVKWVKTYGGNYRDVGSAITVDPKGYIYSTGIFNDDAYFGPFLLTGYPNQPWADFYVDKISPATAHVPTGQSLDLTTTPGNCSDLNIAFVPGNGDRRIIVARESSPVNSNPVNGTTYVANSSYGNGSNLGNGNFVVYNGTGNNVTITNLTAGATYHFTIFEYNGYGMASNFMTTSPSSISGTSVMFPINISLSSNLICAGDLIDVQISGSSAHTWMPSNSISVINDSVFVAAPSNSTIYTVSGKTQDGCDAQSTITINVNPLPVINFSTPNPVCVNSPLFTLNSATPTGGIYSGAGVTGNQFNPMSVGSGAFPIVYTYSDANGCTNDAQVSMQVYSAPGVIISSMASLCENQSPVVLNNGSPAGGIYSGNGVNAGMFNPTIGAGAHQITYTYTNNNGCTGTSSMYVIVKSAPSVNLGNDIITCASNSVILNAGSGFTSYVWSTGETTPTIIADSGGIGLGVQSISVQVSNFTGCTDSDIIQVNFDLCAGIDIPVQDFPAVIIYPNPFQNNFTFVSDEIVSFQIYDVSGRLLDKRENITGHLTAGENLSPGIYFVEVRSGVNKKRFTILKAE